MVWTSKQTFRPSANLLCCGNKCSTARYSCFINIWKDEKGVSIVRFIKEWDRTVSTVQIPNWKWNYTIKKFCLKYNVRHSIPLIFFHLSTSASQVTPKICYKTQQQVYPIYASENFSLVCFLKSNRMWMQIFSRVRIVSRLFLSRFFLYLAVMRFDLINFFLYRLLGRHRHPYVVAVGVRLPTLRNHEWTVCSDEWTQQTDLLPVSIEPEACFWQCYKRFPCRRDLNF